jgi:formate dehydrogenase-N alpha subunit
VASLAATFGRGAMTNHWIDMKNADVVMICGSNAVENHPIAAHWVMKAKENGAVVLSCDPRYTRTTAFSDHYCKLRSGTDIAFVNGMINYALQNDRIQHEYVRHYTNATFLLNSGYGFADGLFAGYDEAARSYDKSKWAYELDAQGVPKRDMTMQHPRCVLQLMKKFFARYDLDAVCNITGSPKDVYRKICDIYTSTWAPDRVGVWLYAMGTTQHSHGTQNIRSYAVLQLLLGNIGLAGGGVNAMRGESNVQGSTDMALLYHVLPGYLAAPVAAMQTLSIYLEKVAPKSNDPLSANWWQNYPKYITSLLKAWYGDHARKDNDFAYGYVPKATGNHSYMALVEAIYAGTIKGLFCFGMNPAVGGPNSSRAREALGKLEWMVAIDLFETDSSVFWKRPGVDPSTINTEVFLLPAAASMEKEGSVANSGRWCQWRYKAVEPPEDARSDAWIITQLIAGLKKAYASGGNFPEPIRHLLWDYGQDKDAHGEPDIHRVAREINGYFTQDREIDGKKWKAGDQVPGFALLQADGSTACGCWIYCASYPGPNKTDNKMARRQKSDPAKDPLGLYPEWAWCWPVNRRILYNRASVDAQGQPWDPKRTVIRWNSDAKKWEGDVPDGPWPPGAKLPFIMRPEGVGCLFAAALADGPFPEHYEPVESPVRNAMSPVQYSPACKVWDLKSIGDPREFPIVATTYRVCEHWQAGAMTRNMSWLVELVPDVFVELSPDLARRKGIRTGEWVRVRSKRGEMKARALVTNRFEPLFVGGTLVDQIGIPWHWGFAGLATGDSANLLTANVGDPNTFIPEFKAFLCDVAKA